MSIPIGVMLAQGANFIFCAVILFRAEPAINQMNATAQHWMIRAAFAALATGAAADLIAISAGAIPSFSHLVLTGGIAALLLCKKRIRLLLRIRPSNKGVQHAQR